MTTINNNNIDKSYQELKDIIKRSKEITDFKLLDNAWLFTKVAHHGQLRLSGDIYASHSLEVAKILSNWKLDTSSIIAGLLHDTVEDGGINKQELVKEFGLEIANLVDGVTKVSNVKLRGRKNEEFVENLRKMFLAMAQDLRVVIIKLADRLHNMQTLNFLPSDKQQRIARETLEIFAPLAERLGMGEIKTQLDDLAFPYVYPKEYKKVVATSSDYYKKTETDITNIKKQLLKKLTKEGIDAKISGRKKHLYSLWLKLERPEIDWDYAKIHDIVALRIIVDSVPYCYSVLGFVHNLFKPVPYLGVSDFIAQPKPNGYQSIHTKVFGPGKRIIEIQITTRQMHQENEFGIAAHWHLAMVKSKKGVSSADIDIGRFNMVNQDKFKWVRQLAEWQNEVKDTKEYLKAVKFDALSQRIFVFTPKGDVYDLPVGSTPVDFAYNVHTDLVEYIKASKVNNRIVPLNYKLKSGDVVEIIKTKNPKSPTADWLDFVATITAKRELSKYLRKEAKKE